MAPASGQDAVDPSHCLLRALYLAEVDRLEDSWFCSQHAGVEDPTGGWDDLTASSVDGVGMEGHVVQVEPYTSTVLFTQYTL